MYSYGLWYKEYTDKSRKDPFTRREAAHEGMYIRAQEAEKLNTLRHKLKEQRKQLDDLEQHV